MKQKNMENHFHTPSAQTTRLAIGIDILKHRKKLWIPGTHGLAYCAKCGRVIDEPEAIGKVYNIAGPIWEFSFVPLMMICAWFLPTKSIYFWLGLGISAVSLLALNLAPQFIAAFYPWRPLQYTTQEELELRIRLRQHPVRRDSCGLLVFGRVISTLFQLLPLILWILVGILK